MSRSRSPGRTLRHIGPNCCWASVGLPAGMSSRTRARKVDRSSPARSIRGTPGIAGWPRSPHSEPATASPTKSHCSTSTSRHLISPTWPSGRHVSLPTSRSGSRAATFRDKADVFPGTTFVVGVDTIERIAEPRYYGNDTAARNAAIAHLVDRGCRFLVFGRAADDEFKSLSDLALPKALAGLCDEVPGAVFREDISSTAIRNSESPRP